ncbi:MAG: hypothetical protein L0H79_05460 [Intrasporangium sp.]|uniref:hypothetical protein n=1 Tax=Intrasporangium sp. TaxID=1925024 RepID=UPI0026479135|nr:hypothetical protein [Intrasporangium sp.]MDN5795184.1 hypothetical protein [Intrasporangium sp.]
MEQYGSFGATASSVGAVEPGPADPAHAAVLARVYRGQRELIDHLLVSHVLLDTVQAVSTGGQPDLARWSIGPASRRR